MSEVPENDLINDPVFSDEYWQNVALPLEEDELFDATSLRSTKYPELGIKVMSYVTGEDGIVLNAGSKFEPNDPGGEEWYEQPGTLSIFDWEAIEIYTPERFTNYLKSRTSFIKPFDEVSDRVGLSARQFFLHGEEPGTFPVLPLSNGTRTLYAAQELDYGVAIYIRSVWASIIETQREQRVGRNIRTRLNSKGKPWVMSLPTSGFLDKQMPFIVGQATEMALSESQVVKGMIRGIERFNRVEVLEVGAKAKSPQRGKSRFAPSLGRLSFGLGG